MIEIQSNILEELRCSKCNEYLSYAPIMITEDGENVCGRCVNDNSDIRLIRYKAYEALAAAVAFPCRYKESGCKFIIPWEDVIVHEDHCEYRLTECPVAPQGTCKWKGSQCALLDHYKESHPELILEHPCSLDANVVVDNDKNMMFSFSDFEFLVQIRCNTALSKLWHCVHCFAMPQVAQQFTFCVKFSSNEGNFKKEMPVLTEKCLTMQVDKSVETKVNSLLELLGDCNNIKVVLSILPKVNYDLRNVFLCVECKNPSLPAVFRNHEKYYCSNCKLGTSFLDRNKEYLFGKILNKCKNINAGCPYFHISKKLMYRHETWECKWQKKCFFGCDINYDELQTHFVKKVHNSILQIYVNINCWHYGEIKKNDNIFLCKCFINKTCTKIYIYSQLPIQDIHLYKCKITYYYKSVFELSYTNRSTTILTLTYTPTAEHDWELNQTYLETSRNPFICTDNNKTQFNMCDITISKEI